ncbi:MAG: DUF3618 domain-containing protein [Pseudohongiella sp.]|uniref:DUF3618 domain-containing protein n=1 Tax=Pseudohongiella sp. TaxID=1979412 RepID=UPI0034A06CE7
MSDTNNTDNSNSEKYQPHDNDHDDNKSPERLEREVDQARTRLGKTANELSDRLSPGELIDQAMGMAREHGGELGRNLGTQVKNNPLPMILTSIGISWMMISTGNNSSAGAHRSFKTGNGRDVGDALGDTAAKSHDVASAVGDRVHDATGNMKESAQSVGQSMVQFYRDQPLLAGSLGIAIGAALGALVPPTEMEDDMFGETRDRSVDAAKKKAESKYDELRESVRSD